jgi:hypothetical protein
MSSHQVVEGFKFSVMLMIYPIKNSLEQAAVDPEALSQETIIQNLDVKEWERLSRIRNIGIAVRFASLKPKSSGSDSYVCSV